MAERVTQAIIEAVTSGNTSCITEVVVEAVTITSGMRATQLVVEAVTLAPSGANNKAIWVGV